MIELAATLRLSASSQECHPRSTVTTVWLVARIVKEVSLRRQDRQGLGDTDVLDDEVAERSPGCPN